MNNRIKHALGDALFPADVAELIATWPLIHFFRLEPGDTVVVAGAYTGKLMAALLELYPGVNVVGFEPQLWAWELAIARLGRDYPVMRWQVYPFGLGDETRAGVPMGEFATDACSFINVGEGSREQGFGNLVEAGEALAPLGSKISLMILNMEGYEFRLLPYLMKKGLLGQVKRLAVQWHPFEQLKLETIAWQDPTNEMLALLGSPAWPHKLVYDERPTWTYSEAR